MQEELDEAWSGLTSNDPGAVIAALEAAFADNDAPAVPVDCEDGDVTVLMLMEGERAFPERVPSVSPKGKPYLRQLSKTERSNAYLEWMASNTLATVREALATAPGIRAVTMVVLRKGMPTPFGDVPLGVFYVARFTREMCERIAWDQPEAVNAIFYADDVLGHLAGQTKRLAQIDLSDHPELQAVVEHVRDALRYSAERTSPAPAFDVVLLASGGRHARLANVIQEITGLGMGAAIRLVTSPPSVIVSGATREGAEAILQRLVQTGKGVQAEVVRRDLNAHAKSDS